MNVDEIEYSRCINCLSFKRLGKDEGYCDFHKEKVSEIFEDQVCVNFRSMKRLSLTEGGK